VHVTTADCKHSTAARGFSPDAAARHAKLAAAAARHAKLAATQGRAVLEGYSPKAGACPPEEDH